MIMTALMCLESLCDDNFMRLSTIGLDLVSAEIFRSECNPQSAAYLTPTPPSMRPRDPVRLRPENIYCQNFILPNYDSLEKLSESFESVKP